MGHFEYAKIIYKYGKNAPRARDSENDPFALVSLQELAVSADRKRTSSFTNNFLKYHTDKNSEYGDKAITNALGDGGKWKNRPNLMRAKAIALASSFHVVFLECIALFRDAYEACEESDSEVGFIAEHNPLDQAAALLIGYLEGETVKGVSSLDGKFTFGLASEKAFQFDTLTEQDDYAVVNSEIEDLLYAAKGQLDVLDCIKVSRTVSHIEDLMMIPLLQGVAQAAASNENINSGAFETSLVEGEMYALTVLPSIDELQTSSADTIYRNMIVTSGDTVPDGSAEVGDAVGRFTTQGMKLSCRYIGGNDDVEPCRNYGGRSLGERRWSLLGLLVSAVAGLTLLW